jgi:hypothetical protein
LDFRPVRYNIIQGHSVTAHDIECSNQLLCM